jgi:hypothetical protein
MYGKIDSLNMYGIQVKSLILEVNYKMRINSKRLFQTLLSAVGLILTVSITNAQQTSNPAAQQEVATVVNSSENKAATANAPVFGDYRGVKIGMTADEVRTKLDRIKKGEGQDFLVFSERESAQIYYDAEGKVTAISIDYFGNTSDAPTPDAVLGAALQAKADGSMYQLKRYPAAGYWVSYNRTAGDKPIITITMQKMPQ